MFRKTKTFPLKEFWEHKLNIKYNIEIEYYKKFCGGSYKYEILLKDTDLYNDLEDITYDNWKRHILKIIENLSIKELKEYSKFLNQQCRDYDTKFTLVQTIFVPLIFYLVIISLSPLMNSLDVFSKNYIYIIFLGGITMLFMYLLIMLLSHKKDVVHKFFYQDIKEIVDERINLIKINTAEE